MQVVRPSKSKNEKLFIFQKTNLIKLEVIQVFEDQWIYCRVIDKNRWKWKKMHIHLKMLKFSFNQKRKIKIRWLHLGVILRSKTIIKWNKMFKRCNNLNNKMNQVINCSKGWHTSDTRKKWLILFKIWNLAKSRGIRWLSKHLTL